MRDYDDRAGGPCEEDVATLRWLEDTAYYVRVDEDRAGKGGQGSKGRGGTGDEGGRDRDGAFPLRLDWPGA
jgi:hypothetical protein